MLREGLLLLVSVFLVSSAFAHDDGKPALRKERPEVPTAPAPRSADLESLVKSLDSDDFVTREQAEKTLRSFLPNKVGELRKLRAAIPLEAEGRSRLGRLIGPYDPIRYRDWEALGQDAIRVLNQSDIVKNTVKDLNQLLPAFGPTDAERYKELTDEITKIRNINLARAQNKLPPDIQGILKLRDLIEETRELFVRVAKRAGMEAKLSGGDTFSLKVGDREYAVEGVDQGAFTLMQVAPNIDIGRALGAEKSKRADSLLAPDGTRIDGDSKLAEAVPLLIAIAAPQAKVISLNLMMEHNVIDNTMRGMAREWLKHSFKLKDSELPEIKEPAVLNFKANTEKNFALPVAPAPREKKVLLRG